MKFLKIFEEFTTSKAVDFKLTKNDKGLYQYDFIVNDIEMVAYIYPNPWEKNYYDVVFGLKDGKKDLTDRVGKDIVFLNTVLKTVANCMINFIDNKDVVRILAFQAEPLRERIYLRFFKNHPYFSNFKYTKISNWNKIHINKSNND